MDVDIHLYFILSPYLLNLFRFVYLLTLCVDRVSLNFRSAVLVGYWFILACEDARRSKFNH